jgi:hypothetical protein
MEKNLVRELFYLIMSEQLAGCGEEEKRTKEPGCDVLSAHFLDSKVEGAYYTLSALTTLVWLRSLWRSSELSCRRIL